MNLTRVQQKILRRHLFYYYIHSFWNEKMTKIKTRHITSPKCLRFCHFFWRFAVVVFSEVCRVVVWLACGGLVFLVGRGDPVRVLLRVLRMTQNSLPKINADLKIKYVCSPNSKLKLDAEQSRHRLKGHEKPGSLCDLLRSISAVGGQFCTWKDLRICK